MDKKCVAATAKWKELVGLPEAAKKRFLSAWRLGGTQDTGSDMETQYYDYKLMKILIELKDIYHVIDWTPKPGRVPIPIYFWYNEKKTPTSMMLGEFYKGVVRDMQEGGFGRCRAPGKLDYAAAKVMSFLG